jgi:pilus assembly protein CpaF
MSLYKRLHEVQATTGATSSRRDPILDELRQKIHHHLIRLVGPVLYDRLSRTICGAASTTAAGEALARRPAVGCRRAQLIRTSLTTSSIRPHRSLRGRGYHRGHGERSRAVFIERAGRIEKSNASFVGETHLRRIIDKIVGQVGRRIGSRRRWSARLPDGSRVARSSTLS